MASQGAILGFMRFNSLSIPIVFTTLLQHGRRLLGALAIGMVCIVPPVLGAQASATSCDSVSAIEQAQRTVMQGARVIDTAQVSLPDKIPRAWRTAEFSLHYQISLGPCLDPSARRAILFSRVGGPYRVLAAGLPVEPVRHQAYSGQSSYNGRIGGVFALDNAALELDVALTTLPNAGGGLVRVFAGPQAQLMAGPALIHERWQQFNLVASAVIGMAGILALSLWLARRQDRQTLWFALACLFWAARGQLLQLVQVPFDELVFEQLNPLLLWLTALLVTASTLWLIDGVTRRRSIGLCLLGVAALVGYGASVLLPGWALPYRTLAFALSFGLLGWMVWLLAADTRSLRTGKGLWLALGYGFVMVGASHDILMILGVLTPGWWTLLTPGFSLLLLCQMVSVGLYLLRHLHRAERANEELELAIAGKTRLLETSFALLRDSERSGARIAERERIMREMHDGLGAQLMTALRGMERGALGKEEVAQSLQEGLDELRLLMDSGDSTQALQTALANWRNRWDARLAATGLTLHWTIDDTLDDLTLSGDTVFQLMRILQEGVTNIVKHAQAHNLSMRASVTTVEQVPCLCLELLDDGKGLGPDPLRAGARGLKNMHYRAQQIGAQITVESLGAPAHGCRVRLQLPLPAIIDKKGL